MGLETKTVLLLRRVLPLLMLLVRHGRDVAERREGRRAWVERGGRVWLSTDEESNEQRGEEESTMRSGVKRTQKRRRRQVDRKTRERDASD